MPRDVLADLLALWRRASAADRTSFLAHVTSGASPAAGGYPEHGGSAVPETIVVYPGEPVPAEPPEGATVVEVSFVAPGARRG